jgi:hypothetical protein
VEQGSGAWAGPICGADSPQGLSLTQGGGHKTHSLRGLRGAHQGGCDGDAFIQGDRVAIF